MEFWDAVIKEYNSELLRLKNIIAEGGAESFSHYRELVGHIQGIEWSRTVLHLILKNNV